MIMNPVGVIDGIFWDFHSKVDFNNNAVNKECIYQYHTYFNNWIKMVDNTSIIILTITYHEKLTTYLKPII